MAVTFGCPLVGTVAELNGKHLKVGQRAYATDGQSEVYVHEGTNWKTGAVDENGNLIVYERLPWDTNMGGDNEVNPSNYYTKKQVDDKVKDGKDIFTFTCNIIENPEMAGGFEVESMTANYDEIENVYKKGKIIKAIGNTWDDRIFILDLVGIVNEYFLFSGTTEDALLTLFLNSDNSVEVSVRYLQFKNNMIQSIERNESADDCYPSVKAVADYVAKYGSNNYYEKKEVDNKLNDTKSDVMDEVINNFVDFSALESILMEGYYTKEETDSKDEKFQQDVEKTFGSLLDRIIALEAKLAK